MSDAGRMALLGRFPGDLCVRVVDVGIDDTMDQVARACAELTLGRTVRDPGAGARLLVRRTTPDDSAAPLPCEVTVAEAGFRHFECVDVVVV
ncbi:toluene-4-monooxygenase system B family protein [Nonomuraea sp. NPDC049480]|uniref:toluene-4-monooxygenase system B family protein n=1 Tax=Nonomuraea sp. NPDC049480 TaxID=3364353 RepID=UPI003797D936